MKSDGIPLAEVKSQLLLPSITYRPMRYPWALEFWRRQQQVHWMPEEVPLGEDVKDWNTTLTVSEKHLLTHIFRFFTQSDIEVNDNYMDRYARVFKPVELKMMMGAFSNMETIHIAAYALLLDTIGMPETEFSAFMDYSAMKDKYDYMHTFGVDTDADVLRTLAMFGAFTEGLQLFASFAILMNFPRTDKLINKKGTMKGMGQIVSWSVRDESLHCEGMIKLFHAFAEETGALKPNVIKDIRDCALHVVSLEDKFIDLAFELGDVNGITAQEVKQYIRYIADWRLRQLKMEPLFGVTKHPLPWLTEMLNGVEHANFFEQRATEYSKAATEGTWHGSTGAWQMFDSYKNRKSMSALETEEI